MMTKNTFRHAALIAGLLATAGFAQAQTQTPAVKAITPKGESANEYPLGVPEKARTSGESRADVKADAMEAPADKMHKKGVSQNAVLPGQTSGIPMANTESPNKRAMIRSEKKSEARKAVRTQNEIPDQASPGTSPPNYKQ